ncbi:MafI family immunity protein [Rhizobium ruizarguesonis]|uniref:MafI family immunity protein n=1 Tax=Rhizobium ruizarguesonis TaxID=2081791 RepID=UPI0010316DFB|nr:MafI family immunity protein [Rhizobium ruizarguesonis]TAZ68790.1 MafI family immunity protein [Rhizobium ruizarguesonis]TAZ91843.1 MafI family immunity protein [Rhizobium ruizarguesonis]TBA14165.1 MafI family immunity protein [Rhizobium ruizarguesonis]TBA54063.1 MafI family immunity protein [Rhizobium ruizarguesonis]TBB41974.1 MafI family immunity protein [Rhizobium ruizarguesonis]
MEIEKRLIDLISNFNGRLAGEDIREYISLAEHNECVVALENLCTQLREYDVVLAPEELTNIQALANEMNLKADTWAFLKYPNS